MFGLGVFSAPNRRSRQASAYMYVQVTLPVTHSILPPVAMSLVQVTPDSAWGSPDDTNMGLGASHKLARHDRLTKIQKLTDNSQNTYRNADGLMKHDRLTQIQTEALGTPHSSPSMSKVNHSQAQGSQSLYGKENFDRSTTRESGLLAR